MPEQTNKCPNCGAILQEKEGVLYCPHCDSKYSTENLNELLLATLATNYITKRTNNTSTKVKQHLNQALHEYYENHYADCRLHLNRVLDYDPMNRDANIIKSLLTKGENGRYISTPSYKMISAIKNWLRNKDYKNTEYVNSLFLSEISSMYPLTFFSIFKLKKMFEQSSVPNKKGYLEAIKKRLTSKIIFKLIFWTLFIILVVSVRSCNSSSSNKSISTTFSVTYYASEGGTVYIPKKNLYYTNYYSYTISSGEKTTAIAAPFSGYIFYKWSDGSTTARREDWFYSTYSLTAYFKKTDSTSSNTSTATNISLNYNAGEGGYISGVTCQNITSGQSGSEVTAKPNFGYKFIKWSDGLTTATRKDINCTNGLLVNAIFEQLFDGGQGTQASPFIINNASNLVALMENCTNNSKYETAYYILGNDIDLTGIDNCKSIFQFKGCFDGNNKIINNLSTTLFSSTKNATIKNLNIQVSIKKVSSLSAYCGGISETSSNTHFTNCNTSGTIDVSGNYDVYAGGIVGLSLYDDIFDSCSSTIEITAKSTSTYSTIYTGKIYGQKN